MQVHDAHKIKTDGNDMANVDGSDDPTARVNYLDNVTKLAGDYKRASYQMIDLRPGDSVLDVGCGTGDDVRAMAEIVGPSGRVVGIDLSRTMIEEARQRSEGSDRQVEFIQCSAYDLPFDDDTFNAARVDRVLQHIDDPVQVLSEMARVVKPGGRMVASDPDFNTRRVTTSYPKLERRIETWWQEWRATLSGNGSRGRYLYEHCLDAGLVDVYFQTAAPTMNDLSIADAMMGVLENARRAAEAGAITPEEQGMWEQDLRKRAERGRFLMTFIGFLVHGRVPEEASA